MIETDGKMSTRDDIGKGIKGYFFPILVNFNYGNLLS